MDNLQCGSFRNGCFLGADKGGQSGNCRSLTCQEVPYNLEQVESWVWVSRLSLWNSPAVCRVSGSQRCRKEKRSERETRDHSHRLCLMKAWSKCGAVKLVSARIKNDNSRLYYVCSNHGKVKDEKDFVEKRGVLMATLPGVQAWGFWIW